VGHPREAAAVVREGPFPGAVAAAGEELPAGHQRKASGVAVAAVVAERRDRGWCSGKNRASAEGAAVPMGMSPVVKPAGEVVQLGSSR
jgi:hypothetical protein